jgi:alpha-ribazole phosphatase
MKLYLVRHPRTLAEPGLCYGASDVACSVEALEFAASQLCKALPKGVKIISSPLSRCEQLAQLLCRLESNFSYKTEQNLAEMDFGAWEMTAWDHIARHELAAWTDDFAGYRCGGTGESSASLLRRVAQLLCQAAAAGEDQIWITHAGVIRAVLWLSQQPYATIASLIEPAAPWPLLSQLRAADWPKSEVAFGQVWQNQPWQWPLAWPLQPPAR